MVSQSLVWEAALRNTGTWPPLYPKKISPDTATAPA